ncbi:hypothetical protein OIE13_04435 [Streptosporangium sp. NBC_01810]|nr:hypothetical protein OIE13_04435 [Streptosporangium sp. NBC_01810]
MNETPTGLDTQVVVDRRVLAGYDNYLAAQRTVDGLSDAGFPVENVAIVGSDLKLEETVTGRVTDGRAALTGAGSGAAFGAMVGMFLGLFTSTALSFIVLVLWAALWGAVMGAAFGFINHAFTRGKRDFASRSAIIPSRSPDRVGCDTFQTGCSVRARTRSGFHWNRGGIPSGWRGR